MRGSEARVQVRMARMGLSVEGLRVQGVGCRCRYGKLGCDYMWAVVTRDVGARHLLPWDCYSCRQGTPAHPHKTRRVRANLAALARSARAPGCLRAAQRRQRHVRHTLGLHPRPSLQHIHCAVMRQHCAGSTIGPYSWLPLSEWASRSTETSQICRNTPWFPPGSDGRPCS